MSFRKSFWKTNKGQRGNHVEVLKVLKPEENQQDVKSTKVFFPKEMRINETKI